jgi:hypothetical protein
MILELEMRELRLTKRFFGRRRFAAGCGSGTGNPYRKLKELVEEYRRAKRDFQVDNPLYQQSLLLKRDFIEMQHAAIGRLDDLELAGGRLPIVGEEVWDLREWIRAVEKTVEIRHMPSLKAGTARPRARVPTSPRRNDKHARKLAGSMHWTGSFCI